MFVSDTRKEFDKWFADYDVSSTHVVGGECPPETTNQTLCN